MDLSILIVNWNTRAYTTQCLQTLVDTADNLSLDPGSLRYGTYSAEVIVVDNASVDDSVSVIRQQFPWTQLIENDQNVGFARGNNQAFAASSGRYVLLLNSDTAVKPGALQTLLQFMEDHPRCGGCGARLLNADGSLQPSCQPMLTPWREFWKLTFVDQVWRRSTYDMASWGVSTPHPVETIKGACLLARRTALDTPDSLLDDRYFMYTEEIDLCYRLMRDGWQLYWVPQASVTHFGEASSKQAYTKMYVQLYRSKVQFYRKFGGDQRANRFKRLVTAAYWPRFIAAKLIKPFRPSLTSRAETFRLLLDELPTM
jgi:GT2 family glycosyltransferase